MQLPPPAPSRPDGPSPAGTMASHRLHVAPRLSLASAESAARRLAGHTPPRPPPWKAWALGNTLPWKFVAGTCRTKFPASCGFLLSGPGSPSRHCFRCCSSSLAGQACPRASGHQPALWLMKGQTQGRPGVQIPSQEPCGRQETRKAEQVCTNQGGQHCLGAIVMSSAVTWAEATVPLPLTVGFRVCAMWQLSTAGYRTVHGACYSLC